MWQNPFLNTSPEYNALMEAKKRNIESSFIDLPYGEILIHTAENMGIWKKREIASYSDDYYLSENKIFQVLCEKTGLRNFEEFWEKFFEIDALYINSEEFVARMMSYCYLIRQNTLKEKMQEDGCLIREQHMAYHIKEASAKYKHILVVTGGFHTLGLYELMEGEKKIPKVKLHNFSEDIQNVYPMCYSLEAADALNGYGAGMQNPGFYEMVWQGMKEKSPLKEDVSLLSTYKLDTCFQAMCQECRIVKNPAFCRRRILNRLDSVTVCTIGVNSNDVSNIYSDAVLDILLKTAKAGNKENFLITMSDISSAVTMYKGLSLLRDKKAPGLYELYDSVQGCFVKGELNAASEIPLRILRKIATGSKIGKLCANAPKTPLLINFEELCMKYKLKRNTIIKQKVELEIFSKSHHRKLSRFFYQMGFLETDFVKRIKGADIIQNTDRNRIREVWSYSYSIKTDAALYKDFNDKEI